MTTHARKFASVPARTGSDTWRAIADVFSSNNERPHFDAALNAAAILIADEVTTTAPIVITGAGPRIHLYTIHGEDAVSGHNINESPVPNLVFSEDWTIYLPKHPDDSELIATLIDDPHIVIGAPPVQAANDLAAPGSRISGFDLSALEAT